MNYLASFAPLTAALALIFAYGLSSWIKKADEGTEKMREAAGYIKASAIAPLKRDYKAMIIVSIALFAVVGFIVNWLAASLFIAGAAFSAIAGVIGMRAAVSGAARTANSAIDGGVSKALKLAFRSGAVMGLCITGFGLLGMGTIVVVFSVSEAKAMIAGFAFGVSVMAFFSLADGGIFSKAADMLESYTLAVASAIILSPVGNIGFPLFICAAGILAGIAGIIFVRGGENTNPTAALNMGRYVGGFIIILCSVIASKALTGAFSSAIAVTTGLLAGFAISKITEICTVRKKRTISGEFAAGIKSAVWLLILIAAALLIANAAAGRYGITLAAVGMLSTVCMTISLFSFASVSEDASDIAEVSVFIKEAKDITDNLKLAGNTVMASGKGLAAGAAAFAAFSVFLVFSQGVMLDTVNLLDPTVIAGFFIGAALPLLFSSLMVNAFSKAAGAEVKKMIAPGLFTAIIVILVGAVMGTEALGAALAGAIASGTLTAVTITSAGGAWNNAVRYIDSGNYGGKRSKSPKTVSIGEVIGNPFKGVASPSINSIIKLIAILSVLFQDVIVKIGEFI